MKDKSQLDQLIINDNNEIISQKFKIHEELKTKIIDDFNDKIYSLHKKNIKMMNENNNLKQEIVNFV